MSTAEGGTAPASPGRSARAGDEGQRAEILARLITAGRGIALALISLQTAAGRALGIHPTDIVILLHLQTAPDEPLRTPGDLARLTGLTTGAITGVIDRLERDGYVRRERDPVDRRKVVIVPTGRDIEAFDSVVGPMLAGLAELCATYSTDQLTTIADYLAGSLAVAQRTISDIRDRGLR